MITAYLVISQNKVRNEISTRKWTNNTFRRVWNDTFDEIWHSILNSEIATNEDVYGMFSIIW